jgi:hypothetical protein
MAAIVQARFNRPKSNKLINVRAETNNGNSYTLSRKGSQPPVCKTPYQIANGVTQTLKATKDRALNARRKSIKLEEDFVALGECGDPVVSR